MKRIELTTTGQNTHFIIFFFNYAGNNINNNVKGK